MPILYAPPHWEPRQIPDSEVTQSLKAGYRRELPFTPVSESTAADSETTDINTAPLKALVALPGIGTAIAKKIVATRPYASIEDLVQAFPDLDRVLLEPKVSFHAAE